MFIHVKLWRISVFLDLPSFKTKILVPRCLGLDTLDIYKLQSKLFFSLLSLVGCLIAEGHKVFIQNDFFHLIIR